MPKDKKQNKARMNDEIENNRFENNECPKKDKDGNCLVPGVHSDSDPIGGG